MIYPLGGGGGTLQDFLLEVMESVRKLETKKVIETELCTYYIHVQADIELEQYTIRIYDVNPEVRILGIPIKVEVDPVIEGTFDAHEPIQEKVVELIKKYELPYAQIIEFEKWSPETTLHVHDWREGSMVLSKQILDVDDPTLKKSG